MTWVEWLDKYKVLLDQHPADYEREFVLRVLSKVKSITPEMVVPQFNFKDHNGKNRYIDFMIIINKNIYLAIELDGKSKFDNYSIFDDTMMRQNDLIKQFKHLLRFTNKQMLNETDWIIASITEYIKELKIPKVCDLELTEEMLIQFETNRAIEENIQKMEKELKEVKQESNSMSFGTAVLIVALALIVLILFSSIAFKPNKTIEVVKEQPKPTYIQAVDAKNHIGEYKEVCGFIADIKQFSKGVYINLDGKYPNIPFTIVVWERDFNSELDKALNEIIPTSKICIHGKIEGFKDKPQISLTEIRQIRKWD